MSFFYVNFIDFEKFLLADKSLCVILHLLNSFNCNEVTAIYTCKLSRKSVLFKEGYLKLASLPEVQFRIYSEINEVKLGS